MSKDNDDKAVKTNPTVPADLYAGDIVAVTHYAKVTANDRRPHDPTLRVENLDHEMPFEVHGDPLIAACYTADRFTEEVKVPRTRICEILTQSYGVPFTVCFVKKEGEERTLRGRLVGWEEMYGRSKVEDLDKPKGDRFALVDHRTVKWLIVRGVKYISNSRS